MVAETFNAILPLFGILLAGYFAARVGLVKESASETLNQFVFSVSLPALIFISLARLSPSDFFNWPFVGTLMGGMFVIFGLGFFTGGLVFGQRRGEAAMHALNSMFSSTGYIGLPLLLVLYGEEILGPGVFGAVVTGAVFLPMSLLLIETEDGGSAKEVQKAVLKVLRSPIMIATASGLLVSASGLAMPTAVASFCDLIGAAFVPCALFSAGIFFVRCSVKGDVAEVMWLTVVKLAVHPLVTWAIGVYIFDLEGLLLTIAVLSAALPTGVPAFVLAQQYNVSANRTSAVVVLSTAVSVISLTIVLSLVQ